MSENINLATYKRDNNEFQISVDPDLAMKFKEGEEVDIVEVLNVQTIFADAKKGYPAKDTDLEAVFKTTDVSEVAKIIIQKGDVQVSADYRNKKREQKRKQIVNMIHVNAINPQTKLPHPETRIESAIEEAKVKIDERKSANEQLQDIVKQLRSILPIKFETKKIQIVLPANHAGKGYSQILPLGDKLNEKWQNDGSLMIEIKVPAGIEPDVYDKVNSMTHGEALIKTLDDD